MEMKYLKCFVLVFLCLHSSLRDANAASLGARLTALENIFHNQLYLLRETIQNEVAQRDSLTQKMNETFEFFERFQNEFLGNAKFGEMYSKTEKEYTSNDDIIKEVTDMLVRHRRGLQEEKEARKKDNEYIVKQIKDMLSANTDEMKEQIRRMDQKLDGLAHFQSEIKELVAGTDVKLDDAIANVQKSANSYVRDGTEAIKNMTAVIVGQNNRLEIKTEYLMTEIISIGEQCKNIATLRDDIPLIKETSNPPRTLVTSTSYQNIIRLSGGTGPHEGRVELFYNGSFGTVCDDSWDDIDATVVCKMHGYLSGTALQGIKTTYNLADRGKPVHNFGAGSGQILLDNVNCNGEELSLFDCQHSGIGNHYCKHKEDAGVRCT